MARGQQQQQQQKDQRKKQSESRKIQLTINKVNKKRERENEGKKRERKREGKRKREVGGVVVKERVKKRETSHICYAHRQNVYVPAKDRVSAGYYKVVPAENVCNRH